MNIYKFDAPFPFDRLLQATRKEIIKADILINSRIINDTVTDTGTTLPDSVVNDDGSVTVK